MSIRYHFPAWVAEHVGADTTPASLQVWLYAEGRGPDFCLQQCANLLRRPPRRIDLEVWGGISNRAGVPLSTLIEWQPDPPGPRMGRRRRGWSPHRPKAAAPARALERSPAPDLARHLSRSKP